MSAIVEWWSYDFVRHATWAAVLASVLCGVIGTLVVVKRLVFISGGVSHAAFAGLGLFVFLGWQPPEYGAALVAVLVALVLARVGRDQLRAHDAAIGVLWAVGMALGMIFLHARPSYTGDLGSYLFGDILTVAPTHLYQALVLVAMVLLVLTLFYKEIVAVVFDESFAAVQGVPVRGMMAVVMVLVALSVVQLIRLVGILLVIALLTIPPLIALRLVRGFVAAMLVSVGVGLVVTLGGLAATMRFDLPAGPSIVLVGAVLLVAVEAGARLRA